ncbi:MAG: amidohydrolase [Acidimicrobiales bacterium]|uniref:amidohydrolase family protein n=1 Tax=Candidatus Poriferisodalis multihospitum TaxID=2983191 RepID=UPI00137E8075|nr:amidohydrolase family protein [Candidatus Poriferisodalis multihospitum]MXV86066.1 amidohydrolase [Acidimicrobiales bacterium]MYB80786.1 amidohydrolase [Acidimicrobiales bacterium]MYI11120.1 amidohydrolase [Acidimicrobiales bacterium]
MAITIPEPDVNNVWRTETPGNEGWLRSARPDADDKFFMCSADGHVQEPNTFLYDRIDPAYHHRLPTIAVTKAMDVHGKGGKDDSAKGEGGGATDEQFFQKAEGFRPAKLNWTKPFEGHEKLRNQSGRSPEARLADLALDGCDAEVLFPNKGLSIWATPDADFSHAMCRAYNEWAWEEFADYNDRLAPMACIAPAALDKAIAEIQRCAGLGFKGLSLPAKPVFGPPDVDDLNYNLREMEPLWDCIDEVELPVTFHVSTGRDPRTSRSQGGAVINYAVHSLAPTMEPLVNICASGVAERHPKLQFGSIEAGIGWVPWMLTAMDEAYLKHHMWVRPKLEMLPSEYFKRQGFASFQEDPAGLDLAREHGLVDNFLWANDFPHHEGSWPYSAQAIERTMSHLDDGERAKILGLNAARIFGFEIPERYLGHPDAAAVATQR